MKIPRYYMITASWWLVCAHMKPIDSNLVLYRLGKALGFLK